MYRVAHYTIRFKPSIHPNKHVVTVQHGNGQNDSNAIFSTRRAHFYETSAYVWCFDGVQDQRTQNVGLWFPGDYQSKPVQYLDAGGFTVTIVCYVKTSTSPYDDTAGGMNPLVTITDESKWPTSLYLNQVIPNKWTSIKNDAGGFSQTLLTKAPNPVTQRSLNTFRLKNLRYGLVFCEDLGGFDIDYNFDCYGPYSTFKSGGGWNTNMTQWYVQLSNSWSGVSFHVAHDSDYDHKMFAGGMADVFLYPHWDSDSFCVTLAAGFGTFPMKAASNTNMHLLYGSNSWNHESRFVWYIDIDPYE